HDYAVTFVTGAGESLPSPLVSVTVGGLTPPTPPTLTLAERTPPAITDGVHSYAVTFVTAAGETTSGTMAGPVTHGPLPVETPDWHNNVYNNIAGGSLTASTYYGYVCTFVTASGETLDSSHTFSRFFAYADALNHQFQLFNLPISSRATVTARKIYRTIAGGAGGSYQAYYGALHYVTTISDNT